MSTIHDLASELQRLEDGIDEGDYFAGADYPNMARAHIGFLTYDDDEPRGWPVLSIERSQIDYAISCTHQLKRKYGSSAKVYKILGALEGVTIYW